MTLVGEVWIEEQSETHYDQEIYNPSFSQKNEIWSFQLFSFGGC